MSDGPERDEPMSSPECAAAPASPAPTPGVGSRRASKWVGLRLLAATPLTLALAALCLALGWLSFAWGPPGLHHSVLWHMGSNGALSFAEPERLLANVFLHLDENHLFNNVLALVLFGSLIEPTLGARRFLVLYAVAGLLGSVAMVVLHPKAVSLGASGAIWALMTAELRLDTSAARKQWQFPEPRVSSRLIPQKTQRIFRVGSLVLFAILLNSGPHVGVSAHVTGGLVGLVLAPVLQRWERVSAHASSSAPAPAVRRRSWLSISAGLAGVAMLVAIPLAILRGHPWQLDEVPALERVQLADGRFSLDLPALVAHDISEKPDGDLRVYNFGESGASPIVWSFMAYEVFFSTTREAYVAQMLEQEQQVPNRAGWKPLRPVALVTVGTREAVRVERRNADGREKVAYEMLVGPYRVSLTAYREGPAVWGDVEERVAASLGMFRD